MKRDVWAVIRREYLQRVRSKWFIAATIGAPIFMMALIVVPAYFASQGAQSERDISIGEISFLLGFSHPNAFHKAFKRWLGETPSQYRAKVRRRS